jgi:hypothetical protein
VSGESLFQGLEIEPPVRIDGKHRDLVSGKPAARENGRMLDRRHEQPRHPHRRTAHGVIRRQDMIGGFRRARAENNLCGRNIAEPGNGLARLADHGAGLAALGMHR